MSSHGLRSALLPIVDKDRANWHITLCYVVIETMINDNTDDPHIVFQDVDKLYGSTLVLERVALEARRGDFVSIIGPRSGKSTTSDRGWINGSLSRLLYLSWKRQRRKRHRLRI